MNVDAMLRGLTLSQFREWQAFDAIDPFDDRREDYRTASIVAAIYNTNRNPKKHRKPYPIADFVLRFGDAAQARPKQSWQAQKQIGRLIAASYGADV